MSAGLPLADLSALAGGSDGRHAGPHPHEIERAGAVCAIVDEMRRALLRLDMLQALGYRRFHAPEV